MVTNNLCLANFGLRKKLYIQYIYIFFNLLHDNNTFILQGVLEANNMFMALKPPLM